ncbi:MAG: hypothetical protein FJ290_14625 [Planctomycetes bacterium]|nr:hypothetical protein [Planctomycetota bacterium]
MSTVEEIQAAIGLLSSEDYVRLRRWFLEQDWDEWDREIERDSASGALDFLINEAATEKAKGNLREL